MAFGLAGLNMLMQIPQGYQQAQQQALRNQLLQQEVQQLQQAQQSDAIAAQAMSNIIPGVSGVPDLSGMGGGPPQGGGSPVPFAPSGGLGGGPQQQGGMPPQWGVNPGGAQMAAYSPPGGGGGPSGGGGGPGLDQDVAAIGRMESGGNYQSIGPPDPKTGAVPLGKYQVMSSNVGQWSQEVLGQPLTPQQFLASPRAQDAIARAKFGEYEQKYGREGAARAWIGGPGGVNRPGARDVLGTSVGQYGQNFMAQAGGGGGAPQGAGPQAQMGWKQVWDQINRNNPNAPPLAKMRAMEQVMKFVRPDEQMAWRQQKEMFSEFARMYGLSQRDESLGIQGQRLADSEAKTAKLEGEKKDRIKGVVDGIEDGTLPPSMIGMYKDRAAIEAEAHDRGVNIAQKQVQWQQTMLTMKSLSQPRMLQFFNLNNTVDKEMDEVLSLSEKMGMSGMTDLNRLQLEGLQRTSGNTERGKLAGTYLEAVTHLKDNMSNLVTGGYAPTESAWQQARNLVDENWGVGQMHARLTEAQKLIRIRLNAYKLFGENLVPGGDESNPYIQRGGGPAETPAAGGASNGGFVVGKPLPEGNE